MTTYFLPLLLQLALGNLVINSESSQVDVARREANAKLAAVGTEGTVDFDLFATGTGTTAPTYRKPNGPDRNLENHWCYLQDNIGHTEKGVTFDGPLAQMAIELQNCEMCDPKELMRLSGNEANTSTEFDGFHMSRYMSYETDSSLRKTTNGATHGTTKVTCRLGSTEKGYKIDVYNTQDGTGLKECWTQWIADTDKLTLALQGGRSQLRTLETSDMAGKDSQSNKDAWLRVCGGSPGTLDYGTLPEWFITEGDGYWGLKVTDANGNLAELSSTREREAGDKLVNPMVSLFPIAERGKTPKRVVLKDAGDIVVEYRFVDSAGREIEDETEFLAAAIASLLNGISGPGFGGYVCFMNGVRQKDDVQCQVRNLSMPILCCKTTEEEIGSYESTDNDGDGTLTTKLQVAGIRNFIRSQKATVECKEVRADAAAGFARDQCPAGFEPQGS